MSTLFKFSFFSLTIPALIPTLILASIFYTTFAEADVSRLRFVGVAGLSQALVIASDKEKSLESPLGFSSSIDYLLNSRYDLGAEHMRSLSKKGTTVGFTGITLKYYFWFSHPQFGKESSLDIAQPHLQIKSWTPYLGTSIGFAQASLLEPKISAVGIYTTLKGGIDFPLTAIWGFRCEGNYAFTTIGSGSIQMFNGLIGFYIFL